MPQSGMFAARVLLEFGPSEDLDHSLVLVSKLVLLVLILLERRHSPAPLRGSRWNRSHGYAYSLWGQDRCTQQVWRVTNILFGRYEQGNTCTHSYTQSMLRRRTFPIAVFCAVSCTCLSFTPLIHGTRLHCSHSIKFGQRRPSLSLDRSLRCECLFHLVPTSTLFPMSVCHPHLSRIAADAHVNHPGLRF
jgi:hypothetical protein